MIGIYKITNTYNGKVYIGQSKDIEQRHIQHFTKLENGNHPNKQMQKEYNIYKKYFTFALTEECPLSLLNRAEKYWIEYYKSNQILYGYNQNAGGGYKNRKKNGRPTCLLDDLTS